MISLALSFSKPSSSSELGEAPPPAADVKAANGAFSAVLASLGQQQTVGTAIAEGAAKAAANGIALPVPAETGNILPAGVAAAAEGLPRSVAGSSEDDAETEATGAGAEGPMVALPLIQLPVTDMPVSVEASQAQSSSGSSSPVTAEAEALPSGALPAQASREGGKQAGAPSVALQVAPEATTAHAFASRPSPTAPDSSSPASAALSAQVNSEGSDGSEAQSAAFKATPEADSEHAGRRDAEADAEFQPAKARQTLAEGIAMPKGVSADSAQQGPAVSSAPGLQAEGPQARPLESTRPTLQADALQDLTRIVDRLAAAREAAAPAAAALAVKHADFGELSLRFDQQRDGQLSVQLSASDPDAHRAIAAAVHERGSPTASDSHTGASQSHAQGRGAAAERDGNGSNAANGNAERRGQQQQQRSASPDARGGNGAQRNGIFA